MKSILILCLISINCFGQKVNTNIDKITGDTTRFIKSEKIFGKPSFSGTVGEQLHVATIRGKNGVFLAFTIQTGKTSIFSVDQGDKAFIRLADGSVITMEAIGNETSKYTEVSYGSHGMAFYKPSDQDIIKLKTSSVAVIRFETSRGNYDYDIKDKFSQVIGDHLKKL